MTLTDIWLPIGKHAQDLLEHSDEMVNETSERGLKIGLILADNAVEILLREYLRYYKGKSPRKVENLVFHQLIQESQDLDIVLRRKNNFLFSHDTHNLLYHNGALLPSEDVQSCISFAKQLFNELHPDHKLPLSGYPLPSINTIKKVREKLNDIYISEMYFVTLFEKKLRSEGYTVNLNSHKPNFRFDLMDA